jgi:prophage tail gpP-like protein
MAASALHPAPVPLGSAVSVEDMRAAPRLATLTTTPGGSSNQGLTDVVRRVTGTRAKAPGCLLNTRNFLTLCHRVPSNSKRLQCASMTCEVRYVRPDQQLSAGTSAAVGRSRQSPASRSVCAMVVNRWRGMRSRAEEGERAQRQQREARRRRQRRARGALRLGSRHSGFARTRRARLTVARREAWGLVRLGDPGRRLAGAAPRARFE